MTSIALDLTRDLTRFNTINPPGDEQACAQYLGRILEAAGFMCAFDELAPGRPNLVARIGGKIDALPIGFTGHMDVVPLGARPWSVDPFAAELKDGRIYGRGTTDMKAGIAAFVAACIDCAPRLHGTSGVAIVITAGEETGCEGALHLGSIPGSLPKIGALVVAEPTSNRPLVGHRGALWLKAVATGVTAHGSMPQKGVNALYKIARAIGKLETFDFNVARHPVLGAPTLNVGWAHGGINVNSVPDRAEAGIDIRTIPAQDHALLRDQISHYLGSDIALDAFIDLAGVWTDPETAWLREVFAIADVVTGITHGIEGAPYFTDASALAQPLGRPPMVILGPGEATLAHQTDEYCEIARIEQAQDIYRQLITRWCGI